MMIDKNILTLSEKFIIDEDYDDTKSQVIAKFDCGHESRVSVKRSFKSFLPKLIIKLDRTGFK